MRARDKRIGRVQQAIDASPVCEHTLGEDYEWFRCFGELPDDDHVAYEIVMQALNGGEQVTPSETKPFREREQPREQWPPSVRALLFDEALAANKQLRMLARAVIATEVAWGGDVENPGFAARHGIPTYGCVAMHVGGYTRRLKAAPYEDQATRLFIRHDNMCGRIGEKKDGWFASVGEAMAQFLTTGELPDDDLVLDTMLVFLELDMLGAHRKGTDVAEVMALLDSLARAKDDERDDLLAKLSAKAAAGELRRTTDARPRKSNS